jgi:hypothetical protein
MSDIEKAFDWQQISCPQFAKMLWKHNKKDIYQSGGAVIDKTDKRLIDYLEKAKTSIPINIEFKKHEDT